MYESNFKVSDLKGIINSIITIPITVIDKNLLMWVNEIEQLLYGEVIKEPAEILVENVSFPYEIPSTIRFDDITKVFVDDVELAKATIANSFDQTYFKINNPVNNVDSIDILPRETYNSILRIIYNKRPPLKVLIDETLKVPPEWVKIFVAYCKSMAFKEYNDFAVASNWLAEYNAYVADFKNLCDKKNSEFGR